MLGSPAAYDAVRRGLSISGGLAAGLAIANAAVTTTAGVMGGRSDGFAPYARYNDISPGHGRR